MYVIFSEAEIKSCNLDDCGMKKRCEQHSSQCSLCYSARKVSQAIPLLSCWTWKLPFNQWGLKEASWQPIKSRKHYVVLPVNCPLKLFQPFASVVLLSSQCLPLFLFPGPERAAQEARFTSLGELLHTFAEHHAEKINSSQLGGRWLAVLQCA